MLNQIFFSGDCPNLMSHWITLIYQSYSLGKCLSLKSGLETISFHVLYAKTGETSSEIMVPNVMSCPEHDISVGQGSQSESEYGM